MKEKKSRVCEARVRERFSKEILNHLDYGSDVGESDRAQELKSPRYEGSEVN